MTIPEIHVDLGFTAPGTGTALHIGDRVRGIIGTNTIASDDLFTDVTDYVKSVNIRRGATRADGPVLRYESGTATIVLRNDDRRFDPTNLSGPYVSGGRSQVEPMRAVQVRATWDGVTYALFRGFTDDWGVDYDGPNSSFATVTCFDAFGVFASHDRNASGAVGAGEDTGARINRILDSITWPDEDRMVDTGDETVQSTTLADNTLSELQLTADTELGHLFMDPKGRVRFRRRLADVTELASVYPQVTFGDAPEDGDPTVNLATNPSAELAITGWVGGGFANAPTLSQSSTRARFGTYSVLATWATASSGDLPLIQYTATGLTVGETYTASVYAWVPAGSPSVAMYVPDLDQWGDNRVGTDTDQWVRLTWTGTASSASLLLQVWPHNSTTTAGQQVWLDGLQIEEGTEATDYCDGDQASCEWDGLEHESTSRRLPELPYADAPLTSDKQSIANLVSIARAGGTAQEVEDAASRTAYLTKTFQRHDLLMQTDAEALMYAEQILGRASSPELRFARVELKPTRDERLWPHALGRQFGDRARVRRRPPGGGAVIEREVLVRGVEHEFDKEKRWVTRLVMQDAPTITEIIDNFNRVTAIPVLNSNPYFETDASGWSVNSGGTIARSTAQFHEGAASLLFTPDGVTATGEVRSSNASGVVAGQTYRAAAWVRCAASRSVNINIVWRDAGGTFLGSAGAVSTSVTAGTWTSIAATGVAPTNAAQAQISVSMGSTPSASHTLWIDEATLTADAGGWGTAYSGQTWTTSGGAGTDYSTTGTVGRHTHTATGSLHHSIIEVGSTDVEVYSSVSIAVASASGSSISTWVAARLADTSNYYMAGLLLGSPSGGSGMTLTLQKRVAGAISTLSTVAAGTHSAGATWRVRFQVVGSTLRAKAWLITSAEPASWQLSTTDTALTAGTQVGLLSRFDVGNTNTLPQHVEWDNLTATAQHNWV